MKTTTNDRVEEALAKLGAEMPVPQDQRREQVYDCLVTLWKEAGRPPQVIHLAECIGISSSTVTHHLRKLVEEGRVVRLGKGIWLPVDL